MTNISEYWEWPGLEGVYLEDSYVLEIVELPTALMFKMLLVLTEQHPNYSSPRPGEQYCYRSGALEFLGVKNVTWISRSQLKYVDKEGEVDLGNVDALYLTNGHYEIEGDWGMLHIEADRVQLRLDPE